MSVKKTYLYIDWLFSEGDKAKSEPLQRSSDLNLSVFRNDFRTYHDLFGTHLQTCFDEFVIRFHRRFWQSQLFIRTISACANLAIFTCYDLIG